MSLNIATEEVLSERVLLIVEHKLLDSAAELGVLARTDIARETVSLYFAETQGTSGYYRTQLRGLNYAWRAANEWPEPISDVEKGDDIFASLQEKYDGRWEKIPDEAKPYSKAGLKAFMKLPDETSNSRDNVP